MFKWSANINLLLPFIIQLNIKLRLASFLIFRRPSGADSEFFVQLFVEADKGMIMPTTQDLLLKMFKEQNITFAEVSIHICIYVPGLQIENCHLLHINYIYFIYLNIHMYKMAEYARKVFQ